MAVERTQSPFVLASLTLSLAAALSACGGGGDTEATVAAATGVATETASAIWTKIATENGSFTATGTRVRYGAGESWVERTVDGTVQCTNAFFGTDPAPNVVKSCEVLDATQTTAPVAETTSTGGAQATPAPVLSVGPAANGLTASIQPSRLTGTAPLAVMFDATGTRAPGADAFRQVRYSFNFSDDRGLAWGPSGQPKNVQVGGPIASHVFDAPGTYNVSVRATDPSGATSDAVVQVTVQDPNVTYAGTATVCVSPSANYAGCPSGAAQQTALPGALSGKRVLLRRGESFGTLNVEVAARGTQVGAYGSGANPVVSYVNIGSGNTPTSAVYPEDITVSDLTVQQQIIQWISASKVLLYRNTVLPSSTAAEQVLLGSAFTWFAGRGSLAASSFPWPREIFLVENTITATTSGATYNLFDGGSVRTTLMGNVMGSSQMHTARFGALVKSVIAHNTLGGQSADGMRHALKLHGLGLSPFGDTFAQTGASLATSQVVVANNTLGSAANNNQWTVSITPQNDQSAEGIDSVMVENNRFVSGPNTAQDLVLAGRALTYRGNTRDGGSLRVYTGGHGASLPADWRGPYFAD